MALYRQFYSFKTMTTSDISMCVHFIL